MILNKVKSLLLSSMLLTTSRPKPGDEEEDLGSSWVELDVARVRYSVGSVSSEELSSVLLSFLLSSSGLSEDFLEFVCN